MPSTLIIAALLALLAGALIAWWNERSYRQDVALAGVTVLRSTPANYLNPRSARLTRWMCEEAARCDATVILYGPGRTHRSLGRDGRTAVDSLTRQLMVDRWGVTTTA